MKILHPGEVLVTDEGVYRYDSENRIMVKVEFEVEVTPKLGTGDDPK